MRTILLAVIMVATAACGAYRFPGASPAGTGTVSGHVTVYPCMPVEVAAQPPCGSRPVAGLEINFNSGGMTVATQTDSTGAYSVQVAEGTWTVSFRKLMRIISGPPTVTVHAGEKVVANYVVDSGIRVPVAKEPPTAPRPPKGGGPA